MPKPLSQQERKDLADAVEKGRMTDDFIGSWTWTGLFSPYLQAEERDCEQKNIIKPFPGMTTEAIALQNMFNSGMKHQCHKFREDMAIWIEKGKSAKEELERDNALLGESR